jgi:hypothetical protein
MIFQIGDEGSRIIVRFMKRDDTGKLVPDDISASTTQEICLESPTPVTKVLAAAFDTDGRDGKIVAVSVPGTFDVAGSWKISGHISGTNLDRRTRSRVFLVETPVCP